MSTLDGAPTRAGAHQRAEPQAGWWSEVRAMVVKDIRSELRTRAAVTTILLFALVLLLIVALSVTTEGFGLTRQLKDSDAIRQAFQDPAATSTAATEAYAGTSLMRAKILSSLYWIVLFFSAMAGLPRTFLKEEEMRTASILRLTARPSAVYAGKLMFNAGLILAVTAVIILPFLILFRPIVGDWPMFLLHLPLGALVMAGTATLLGAIVARAGGKTYLMLPLAFPILLPVLVCAINGTTAAIHGKGGNWLVPLVSYGVVIVTASALLFETVWSD